MQVSISQLLLKPHQAIDMKNYKYGLRLVAIMLLVVVFMDFSNMLRLIALVNAIDECKGMTREYFLCVKIPQFSEKWGRNFVMREYGIASESHRIMLTITRPVSFFALLFTDYTNLVYIGISDGQISSVFCVL